jgi:hypothetical protein
LYRALSPHRARLRSRCALVRRRVLGERASLVGQSAPRARYPEIVDGLEPAMAATRIGSGVDTTVTMGPHNTRRQRDYVVEPLDQARSAGIEVRGLGHEGLLELTESHVMSIPTQEIDT